MYVEKQNQSSTELAKAGESAVQANGYRPEKAPLDQLQALTDASPRVSQLRAIQAKVDSSPRVSQFAAFQERAATRPNHTGLPDRLKNGVEALSGISLDKVKVHSNSEKPAQLNAHAYAQGTDIHVAPGQESHLPHEAWHVVQQAQGRVNPTVQMAEGVSVNDDTSLEQEADVMGARAASAGVAQANAIASHTNGLNGLNQHPVQMVEDMTHLETLDLSKCILPSSGRSGNTVLLGDSFVYKLFNTDKEYEREVSESSELANAGGINVLFYSGMDRRKVKLPNATVVSKPVMMMYRASGTTFMLAKSGGIKSFKNIVDTFANDKTQLSNLHRAFKGASDAGIKDAQFIYDSSTNTPHFMDVHLGGVQGGGDCGEIADYIQGKLDAL